MESGSKQFDDIFRNKLKDLSVETNPSDWIMMERLLVWEGLTDESADMGEMRFDEVTIDKLHNIPVDDFEPDWDRMSAMIDEHSLNPSIEPSEFDQAINNQLNTAGIPLAMQIWDKMQPALDADRELVVTDMDSITKEKLTLISEVEPAWGAMNSKINRELFLPESVIKYKVIEVVLIALFAISLFQLPILDIDISGVEMPKSAQQVSPKIQDKANILESTSSLVAEPAAELTEVIETNNIIVDQVQLETPQSADFIAAEEKELLAQEEQTESVLSSPALQIDWNLPPSLHDLMFKFQEEDPFQLSRLAINNAMIPAIKNITAWDGIDSDIKDSEKVKDIFGNTLETEETKESDIVKEDELTAAERLAAIDMSEIKFAKPIISLKCATCDDDQRKVGVVLSMFTGSDFNEIVTPFDPVYAQEGTNQWNKGYGGGLAIGMRFRNWELETGAIYASNQYRPREVFDIYSGNISSGYIASTLKDIELEVVKIPLNFRFNVNLWDNWKVYALSGASLNMVIQSEYITDDVFLGTKTFATPSAPSIQNTNLSLKDFGEGILEGGKFSDNSFLTANLGFGIERTLNQRWSLFAQPTYQRQIFSNGIGPNQDRFNAISLFLGTRITLK